MLSKEEAHKATGMKVSEIVDIAEVPGGYRVTTHDGQTIDLENVDGSGVVVAEPDPDKVPDGSEKAVLAWVGDDRERALAALDTEQAQETPRKGLVDKLTKMVA